MIAVADTSALCYLILIDEIDVLSQLFRHLLIPRTVLAELRHAKAPPRVQLWASALPAWVEVEDTPDSLLPGLGGLAPGETAAIWLAERIAADVLILDEKAARRIARQRGIQTTGTLGILAQAASSGFCDLVPAVQRLRATNFRCSEALFQRTLNAVTPLPPLKHP